MATFERWCGGLPPPTRSKTCLLSRTLPRPNVTYTPQTGSIQLILLFSLFPFLCVECDIGPHHQYTHTTRRVVSKVFPTDFASRKVRTVETVWNEAYFGTLNAHSQAQESSCCKCERRLRRPRQRTKKRALLRRTVKAHCVLTSYCGRSNASPGRQKGEKNIC